MPCLVLKGSFPSASDLIFFLRGKAAFELKRFRTASTAYQKAIRAAHSRYVDDARWGLARAFRARGHFRAALRTYERLLDAYPQHPRAALVRYERAVLLLRLKKRKPAFKELLEIWETYPATSAADAAAERLRRKRRNPRKMLSADRLIRRAKRLRHAKAYDRAIAELRQVGKKHPKFRDATDYAIGYTLKRAHRAKEAIPVLSKLVGRPGPYKRLGAKQLADVLSREGRVDEAVAQYRPYLPSPSTKKRTTNTRARRRLPKIQRWALQKAAKLLAEHARYGEAVALLKQLAAASPRSRRQSQELAWQLAYLTYRSGEFDEAVKSFSSLPQTPRTLYWTARAHHKAARINKAIDMYQRLTEDYLRTYYGLAARSQLVDLKIESFGAPALHRSRSPSPTTELRHRNT